MSNIHDHGAGESPAPETEDRSRRHPGRRSFVKGAALAGAGIAGAGALGLGRELSAQEMQDPARPEALGPNAMLDNRFPISYESSVPSAVRVVTDYFAALSRRDLGGMADQLHFPFGSWEQIDAVVVDNVDEFMRSPPASMNPDTDPRRYTANDGFMKPGCYDVFDELEVINCDPEHVGISLTYNRYGEDGKKLLRCQGIYGVNNNDGRWAIELASTIFCPADMLRVDFTELVEKEVKWLRIDHDIAYHDSNRAVDALARNIGPRMSSSGDSGSTAKWRSGPQGNIMDNHRFMGVESRLSYGQFTAEDEYAEYLDPSVVEEYHDYYNEYRDLFPMSGVGEWGWVYGVIPETRVIHADFHKAHMVSGAIRFNVAGEEASYNKDLGIATYRNGRWGRVGGLTYTCPHDRSTDVNPGPVRAPRGIG